MAITTWRGATESRTQLQKWGSQIRKATSFTGQHLETGRHRLNTQGNEAQVETMRAAHKEGGVWNERRGEWQTTQQKQTVNTELPRSGCNNGLFAKVQMYVGRWPAEILMASMSSCFNFTSFSASISNLRTSNQRLYWAFRTISFSCASSWRRARWTFNLASPLDPRESGEKAYKRGQVAGGESRSTFSLRAVAGVPLLRRTEEAPGCTKTSNSTSSSNTLF